MKKIVVFNGIHSSGKSTIARRLAERDDAFRYFPEVGGQLRLAVGSNALESGESFDREVMRREGARDEELLACPQVPLVETWHLGNAAYLLVRNPQLEGLCRSLLEAQLRRFSPFSVLLDVSWETFRSRATERVAPSQMDELVAFYARMLEATYRLLDGYAIPHVTVRNEGSIEGAVGAVHATLATQKLLA